MVPRILEVGPLLLLLVFAMAGFAIRAITGVVKGEGGSAVLRGVEAAVLAFLGGLIARTFIWVLLRTAHGSPGAGLAVGWGFFLWPGAIDTVARVAGKGPLLTTPAKLLWLATCVGAFAGMMDGSWRTHNWKGLGWLTFPLDMTWALGGVTNGCLLHLVNLVWGDHRDERTGAHRYASGFGVKPGFAFTQGSVSSNLSDGPGTALFSHERTHVWQNRIFGPLFSLSYIGWLVVWLLPGLIAGVVVGAGPFQGVEKWCYFNNPWEAWGYAVQKQARPAFGQTPQEQRLIWPNIFVILWSIPFFGVVLFCFWLVVSKAW
jgi:hypothetical protein